MSKWILQVIAIVLSLSPTAASSAGFYTGNDLKRLCDKGNSFCDGYVIGAIDDLLLQQTVAGAKKYYCIPTGTETGQIIDIVKSYLTAHPENRHWPAPALVANAVIGAYGCAKRLPN